MFYGPPTDEEARIRWLERKVGQLLVDVPSNLEVARRALQSARIANSHSGTGQGGGRLFLVLTPPDGIPAGEARDCTFYDLTPTGEALGTRVESVRNPLDDDALGDRKAWACFEGGAFRLVDQGCTVSPDA